MPLLSLEQILLIRNAVYATQELHSKPITLHLMRQDKRRMSGEIIEQVFHLRGLPMPVSSENNEVNALGVHNHNKLKVQFLYDYLQAEGVETRLGDIINPETDWVSYLSEKYRILKKDYDGIIPHKEIEMVDDGSGTMLAQEAEKEGKPLLVVLIIERANL